ncbi:MAG: hypothetical protein NXI31_11275 [bacterium]|nr:hypothetical protein [bacterium]
MRRRRIVLLTLAALAVGGVVTASLLVWRPLPGCALENVPELAAPLRSQAEHDRLYAQVPFVIEAGGPAGSQDGGRAIVLGMRHTSDESDPQIAALRARFAALRPTLVLVEGRLGWHFGGTASLLPRFGESGEAAALAAATGVRCRSLEPAANDEVADVASEFTPAQVVAFYFLRVFTSERDAEKWSGPELDAEALALLSKRGRRTGFPEALLDLAAMDAFWNEQRPDSAPADWRDLPQSALYRQRAGTWLQRIAERINAFRDRHFVAAIAEGVAAGERVLAVCGSSHAILFEPALRAALAQGR